MPSKLPRVATDFCSASPGSSMWRKTCIVTESAPRGGRAHAPQRGSCKRTANSERNDEGAAASRFERLELLPCSRSLRRLRIFFDQLLEHQTRVELFAELGEGKALAQQRRADFIALRIAPPDFVELDDRLIELLQTEVALADQVLRVGRKAALRIALQEILEARDRGAIVLFLKRAPAALEISARCSVCCWSESRSCLSSSSRALSKSACILASDSSLARRASISFTRWSPSLLVWPICRPTWTRVSSMRSLTALKSRCICWMFARVSASVVRKLSTSERS